MMEAVEVIGGMTIGFLIIDFIVEQNLTIKKVIGKMRRRWTVYTTSTMNEVPMMERTDSKGNMGNQRWMMELEHCLLQTLLPMMMMMMKRKERSVTADTRHPVHGKVVNQNIENRQVVTTRRTSIATVTHQQVVPVAVLAIVGADITAAVLVGNIEEERMMVRIVITI
jgi:hypothetical protein